MDDFIHDGPTPQETGILALTFIGALVGVLGIFWTLLIPAGEVEAIEEEAASIAEEAEEIAETTESSAQGLAAQAVVRIGDGVTSPKVAPGQGAAIYGSIPGALITGSASSWSKIVADAA